MEKAFWKKVNLFLLGLSSIAVLCFAIATAAPVSAAEKKPVKPDEIPLLARGFAGTIEGKVVSKDDTGTTFVMKVDWAKVTPKLVQYNKAKNPEAIKGKTILVHVRWFQVKDTKKYEPGEDQVKFVKELKIGSRTSVDVYSDAYHRLIMNEAPKK